MVETENKYFWTCFFFLTAWEDQEYIREGEPQPWTIMVDRQKRIFVALDIAIPCTRHILANIKTEVKDGVILRGMYQAIVKSINFSRHNVAMEALQGLNSKLWAYLSDIPTKHWAGHAQ